jgi:CDP-glucose 4,6-dehydratase
VPDTSWTPELDFWRHRPVAVTGATGFLGSHVTRELVDLAAHVVVLVRDEVPPTPVTASWMDHVTVVRGSVNDQPLLERALGEYQVRTVLHLAAQSQVGVANRNPVSTWSANITGTCAVLEATRRSATEQVVTASSDKAYGTQPELPYSEEMPLLAKNPYDVSKACADLVAASYAHTWDLPVCITRCGNLFGPGDVNWERIVPGTILAFLEGRRPVIRSDGTFVRDYLYVRDAALAYLQLTEAMAEDSDLRGEAFNFSAEVPMGVLEVVAMLQRLVGTDLEPDVRATAKNEIPSQYLSAAKARKLIGWSPRWTLEEALVETISWYREHGRDG